MLWLSRLILLLLFTDSVMRISIQIRGEVGSWSEQEILRGCRILDMVLVADAGRSDSIKAFVIQQSWLLVQHG